MTTVAEIHLEARTAIKAEITDAFIVMNLIDFMEGAHDTATGTSTGMESDKGTLDVIFDNQRPIGDFFPNYIAGAADQLIWAFNITNTTVPKKGWAFRDASHDYTIAALQDVMQNGTMFAAIVRQGQTVIADISGNAEGLKADGSSKVLKADGASNAKKAA